MASVSSVLLSTSVVSDSEKATVSSSFFFSVFGRRGKRNAAVKNAPREKIMPERKSKITFFPLFFQLPFCPTIFSFIKSFSSKDYASSFKDMGSAKLNSVPTPSVDMQSICSLWAVIILFTILSPRPVPRLSLPLERSVL